MHRSELPFLFDHLVGAGKSRRGFEAERWRLAAECDCLFSC